MSEVEFKCEVCGKTFKKFSGLNRHIGMTKGHPSVVEYYEIYTIPEDKMEEAKIEDSKLLLDDSKKTYVVRNDKQFIQVADMGLANTHSLVAINSEECNEDFIRLLMTIFTRTNVHLCIMGPTASSFREKIPDGLSTSLLIDATAFNYSLAINTLLKPIYEKFPMGKIVICDGWSIFSSIQIVKKEMADIDWDNEFVSVNTVFDYDEDPININMDPSRLSSSVLNRLRNMSSFNFYIPIIICRAKYLLDIEFGLEEEFFTEFSREHLRNQLITAGLRERVCEDNKGLCIRHRRSNTKIEQAEINLIRKISQKMDNYIFIPSNSEIDCGDLNRIKQITIDKGIPKWDHEKYKQPLSKTYNIKSKDEKTTKNECLAPNITITNLSDNMNNKNKVLLMVDSSIRNLVCTTPLIRGLYEKFGVIDVLTKDKLDISNSIIQNYMVRKIYDVQDIRNKFFSFNSYKSNVIKSVGCKIKNPECIDVIEPLNTYGNQIETNYSIVDPYISNLPKPYCNFDVFKTKPSTFVVAISIDKSYNVDASIWNCLDTIGSRIGNNKDVSVYFISLSGERKLFLTDKYRIRRNFRIFDNITPIKACSIINSCSLFLTTSDTQLSWLSWGLDAPTIMLNIDTDIPKRNNEERFNIEDRKSTIKFESVINHVWRVL